MSGLHFVRTGIPDTPKTPLSASSFHEYYSDTPRHHPDIPKTTPRHLQGTQDVNSRQHAPTNTSEHTQTAPVSVLGCLGLSVYACWRLLWSFGILCLLDMSGGVLGMFGEVSGAFEWYSWKSEALGCVWVVSGFSVPAEWSYNTILAKP